MLSLSMSLWQAALRGSGSAAAISLAATLAAGEADALAFDFMDDFWQASTGHYGSAYVLDSGTPANDYDSHPYGLLTHTSPSAKMTIGPSGALRFGAHNLYLNSASPANQSITVVSGARYSVDITGSVSVTASGAATGTWTAGSNTFTAATTTLTLGSTSGTGTVVCRRTPSDDTYLATTDSARYALPYEWDSAGNPLGILVEEARTQLFPYTVSMATTWTSEGNSLARSDSVGTGPDGLDSILLTETGGVAQPNNIYAAISGLISGAIYAVSVLAKAGTNSYLAINAYGTTSENFYTAVFDLTDASTSATQTDVGTSSGTIVSTRKVDLGDGWCRLIVVGQISTTQIYFNFAHTPARTGNTFTDYGQLAFSGTNKTTYIKYPQLELGAFATSVIPNPGSGTVTRAADDISLATSAFPHSATVNSAMIRYRPLNVATAMVALRWDDGTSNEVVSVGHSAAAALGLTVTDGGAAQTAPLTDGTATASTWEKVACSWKANDFLFSDNGAAAVADTSGTLPTVTSLDIGPTLSGHISQILVLPVEKSAAEVAAMAA